LTASPVTSAFSAEEAPAITSPVFTPVRTASRTPQTVSSSAFSRPSSPRTSAAARTARSASSSWRAGMPKTAMTASPMYFSTLPPWWVTTPATVSKYLDISLCSASGSSSSQRLVERTRSMKTTVTVFRSSGVTWTSTADAAGSGAGTAGGSSARGSSSEASCERIAFSSRWSAGPGSERERLAERRGGPCGFDCDQAPAFLEPCGETVEVEVVRREHRGVAARARRDRGRPEGLPEPRDVSVQSRVGRAGRTFAPDLVDDAVSRDDLVRAEEQQRENGARLPSRQCERPVLVPHLQGSENPKLHPTSLEWPPLADRH